MDQAVGKGPREPPRQMSGLGSQIPGTGIDMDLEAWRWHWTPLGPGEQPGHGCVKEWAAEGVIAGT